MSRRPRTPEQEAAVQRRLADAHRSVCPVCRHGAGRLTRD